jgi:hypothetical protein
MPDRNDTEENANTGEDNEAHKDSLMRKSLRWIWNHINNRAPAWQAICAIILTVFNILLYRVSDRATETSRASERAFVNFGGLQPGVRIVGEDRKAWVGYEIVVFWVNSGSTPAKSIAIQGDVQAWRTDLPAGFAFSENKTNSPAVIGPKASYGINVMVSKTDLLDAWHANAHIFYWGSVLYKDSFQGDPDRLSEFCAEMTHVTLSTSTPQPAPVQPALLTDPDILATFQWQACREHNCYDEDCQDYSSKVKTMRK